MTGLILPTVHNSELSLEAEGAFRGIHSAVTLLVYCTAPSDPSAADRWANEVPAA